jgi:hypothetical protein
VIPNAKAREVVSHGVTASGEFGLSMNDAAHLMGILRDTLYSDKILAILREYSANAWDAHREVGKGDLPIKIHLPTAGDTTLTIQDFGPGLSERSVFEVYTQYGASTKRGSDNSVGMLGIGSKSAFAYSDSFTIVSCHDGLRITYSAVLDKTNKGLINKLAEEPCGDETGVTIYIPCKTTDYWAFIDRAKKLFMYFDPRPEINVELPDLPKDQALFKNGRIFGGDEERAGEWVAIMGCVPYRINLEQLEDVDGGDGLAEFANKVSGALYFGIGEVEISASREELKYSDETKLAIVKKVNELLEEYVTDTLKDIDTPKLSAWQKRVRVQGLHKLGLPIPEKYQDLQDDYVRVTEESEVPTTFIMLKQKGTALSIRIDEKSRVFLHDDKRKLSGFHLDPHDYVIKPTGKHTLAEAKAEFEALLEKNGMTGIPIRNLSEVAWSQPPAKGKKHGPVNAKHKVSTFVLRKRKGVYAPYSEAWDTVMREPEATDVYVILDHFKAEGNNGFYRRIEEDEMMAAIAGLPLPPIYGYKTTARKPVYSTSLTGIPYDTWRETFIATLKTPELLAKVDLAQWADLTGVDLKVGYYRDLRADKNILDNLVEVLGENHMVTTFIAKHLKAKEEMSGIDWQLKDQILKLGERFSPATAQKAAFKDITDRYPLFAADNISITRLWNHHTQASHWLDYIKMIDEREEA